MNVIKDLNGKDIAVLTKDEAMAAIDAISFANSESQATNFQIRLAAGLREKFGWKPNEYLDTPTE